MKPKTDTILIIEDDAGLIELMDEKIQECGYPTTCFQTAKAAFDWLENNTPILMILDYSLPDINAREFISTLKSENKTTPPFVVATGQGDERIAVEMMKLGAKEYIIKDGNFLELLPLVACKSIAEIEKDNKLLLNEQKITELSLFNKQIIESAHEGIIVYDRELNYLTWNPFMEKITGILSIDVIGKNAVELSPFLQNSGEVLNIRKAIDEEKITEAEFEFNIHETGKFGWVSETSGPLFDLEGKVIGSIAIVHDITKRKQAEADLRFSEEKFRSITEQIDDYICISDINGIIIYASPVAKTMFLYKPEEVIGHHIMEYVDNEYLSKAIDVLKKSISTTKKAISLEIKLKRKDGSTFFSELNGTKIEFGNETHIVLTIRDISERKKAQEALELTRKSYIDIINTVSEAIYVLDENATFIDVNKGAREMYQLSNEELIGKTPADVAAPGLNNLVQIQSLLESVSKTGASATFEFWAIRKNGEIFPKEVIVNKGRYFEKNVLIATARDITDRKAAQLEIDKIGKHHQALIENAPDGIVLISAEGKFKYASPSARRIFGYTATEELIEHPNELTHPEDLDNVLFTISKIFKDPAFVPTIEYRFLDRQGSWKWVETTFTNMLADPNVSSIVLNFKDITKRKNTESALKQSEKKYRTITESISDVVWTTDMDLNLTFISSSVEKMLGETVEEHMKRPTEKKFTSSSLEKVIKEFKIELENENNLNSDKNRTHAIEVEYCRADGSTFWAEMRMGFLRDNNSKAIGLLGVTRDISERKLAEMQINKLNNCFLTFSSQPHENINLLVKVCGELFDSSCALYNCFQNGQLSILGKWNVPENAELSSNIDSYICTTVIQENSDNIRIIKDLKNSSFASIDPNILLLGFETYIGKSVRIEDKSVGALCVLFKKDYSPSKNEIHLMEIIASAIGVEEERMRVQKVLEVSEDKYRTIIEHSNDWIWMLDIEGCFTFINKTTEHATELNAKDWIGKSFIPLVLEEDLPMLTNVFQKTINGEICNYELRFRKKDTSILTILVNTSPIYEQGKIIGMISFGQDITERKKAENALSESETLYRNLVQRIPDGVYKSTPEGKFIEVNPAMVKMFGYTNKKELLNLDIKKDMYFDEHHREEVMLNTLDEEISVFQLRKKDGTSIWVEDHGWYNYDDNNRKVSNEGVLRDITERKKAEEALNEKMDELMRFHRLMVGRELTMIELKKEVNDLLTKSGQIEKYRIVE